MVRTHKAHFFIVINRRGEGGTHIRSWSNRLLLLALATRVAKPVDIEVFESRATTPEIERVLDGSQNHFLSATSGITS